jgi:arginine-tRNA-protein transferase
VETVFYELRAGTRVLGVAVADLLPDGLSAVYTFFDPDQPARGLGVYAVLWEINEAKRRGLDYLYLGYWIAESQKMSYKIRYQPLEALHHNHWEPLPPV